MKYYFTFFLVLATYCSIYSQEKYNELDLWLKIDSFMLRQGFTKNPPELGTKESWYSFTLKDIKKDLAKKFVISDEKHLMEMVYFPDPNYVTEFGHSILYPTVKTCTSLMNKIKEIQSRKDYWENCNSSPFDCYGNNLIRDKFILVSSLKLDLKSKDREILNSIATNPGPFGIDVYGAMVGKAELKNISEQNKEKLSVNIHSFMLQQGFTNEVPPSESIEFKNGFNLDSRYIPIYYLALYDNNTAYFPIQNYTSPEGYSLINPDKETCKTIILNLQQCKDRQNSMSLEDCLKNEIRNKFIALKCKGNLSANEYANLVEDNLINLSHLSYLIGKVKITQNKNSVENRNVLIPNNTEQNRYNFDFPKNDEELTTKYNSISDKQEKVNYLRQVINLSPDQDSNSLLIKSLAFYYKVQTQALYFNSDTLVSKDEWVANFNIISKFDINLFKNDNPTQRALFLYSLIVCATKSDYDAIIYVNALLNEFTSENCPLPLGAEFYNECKNAMNEYNSRIQKTETTNIKDDDLKAIIHDFVSKGFEQGTENFNNRINKVINEEGCNFCLASGRCKKCTFQQEYYVKSGDCYSKTGWKTNIGYVVCLNCKGTSYKLEKDINCNCNKTSEFCGFIKCNFATCNNGWISCPDCNTKEKSSTLGICKHCNGTGKVH